MAKPGTKHSGKYVAYYRVSTKRQGESGLGLEAQKETVLQHLNGGAWEMVEEFTEVETGRRTDRHRPQLKAALELCEREKATLVVAKLDRLTRNLAFLSRILESRVPFIACDIPDMHNPATTKFMLQLMGNIAEYEAKLISERTKAALSVKKKQGVKLGSPKPKIGSQLGVDYIQKKAKDDSLKICEIIKELKNHGKYDTLYSIKNGLEARGVLTPRGNKKWSISSLRNVMIRGGLYHV